MVFQVEGERVGLMGRGLGTSTVVAVSSSGFARAVVKYMV